MSRDLDLGSESAMKEFIAFDVEQKKEEKTSGWSFCCMPVGYCRFQIKQATTGTSNLPLNSIKTMPKAESRPTFPPVRCPRSPSVVDKSLFSSRTHKGKTSRYGTVSERDVGKCRSVLVLFDWRLSNVTDAQGIQWVWLFDTFP